MNCRSANFEVRDFQRWDYCIWFNGDAVILFS